MDVLYRIINKNYLNFSRIAFTSHPNGHRFFQDLDDLINQKENFIDFIKFEYSTAIIYNSLISIPSLSYFFTHMFTLLSCDYISACWLLAVALIKLLEIIPKIVILYQIIRIGNNSQETNIACRRLMYLTRSNVFYINSVLGYILLGLYALYFLTVRKSNFCGKATQFHFIINWLIFGFFIRLIISLVNYFLHFKYAVNQADLENTSFYKDYNNQVNKEVLELIETTQLTEENINQLVGVNETKERDFCCICMLQFEIGENIKLLPCNKKHIFHNACIDKWLCHNKACPTCRKEISKKLFLKNKFY